MRFMSWLAGLVTGLVAVGVAAVACSSSSGAGDGADSGAVPDGNADPPQDANADSGPPDGRARDAAADGPDLGTCVGTFGSALATGFARVDGTLVAIVRPVDQQCPMPNATHIVLEVELSGAVYRMVASVHSDAALADARVQLLSLPHALPPPAWAEGQHLDAKLDYPTTLGVHAGDFTPLDTGPLVDAVVAALKVGDPVSVYATTGAGRPDSAHLVHRQSGASDDGAIVVAPTSATPRFLLFHFSDQTF